MTNLESINTEELFQLTDGVSLYCGAMNLEKTIFYPFFGIGSQYGYHFHFEEESSIQIADYAEEYWVETHSIEDIHEMFTERQKENPKSVTNTDLYNLVRKVRSIRETRRVEWMGNDPDFGEQGTVMKIDNAEMHILWEQHKGSSLPLFDYKVDNPNIQPVS